MKRILSIFVATATLLSTAALLLACEKEETSVVDEPVGFDINSYDIVYSTTAPLDIQNAANALKDRIERSAGIILNVKDDHLASGEDASAKKEILIGYTDREESKSLRTKLNGVSNEKAFAIEVSGSKIAIMGKNADVTIRAVKYFATNYVSTSEKQGTLNLPADLSEAKVADTSTKIYPENLVELKISKKYNIYLSERDMTAASTVTYPKLVKLQHQANEADNGTMLATFNSSEILYHIMRSTDNGNTWTEVSQVMDYYNTDLVGGRMPHLFELPVDMGTFKKGTVLLAGTSSPKGGNSATFEKSAITLYYSTDLGEKWTSLPSLDYAKGKTNGDGIWEPFLIYEEETKRLYCFYSDDSDPAHDQKLVYKYTTDLKTWVGKDGKTGQHDDPFEAVACNDPVLRPGMISISKMSNGEYIMTYEMVGLSMNPTYAKKTTRLDDWGDISDYGTEVLSDKGNSFGSSPWNAWSPIGGPCGTLVVTGKHRVQEKNNKTAPAIFLSFDYGKTYVELDNPIGYTHNADNRSGYSPCVMFSADGKTLYYAVNPPKVADNTKAYVAMVRIDIIE